MPRAIFWISKLIILTILTTGCTSLPEDFGDNPNPDEKFVVVGSFEEIWAASNKAMAGYRIRASDWDAGLIETESIRGPDFWSPPHLRRTFSPGGRSYIIQIRVIRGQAEGTARANKVIVSKRQSLQRDFFSDPEPQVSDGLEEKVIGYRIRREVVIDRAIKRAFKKSN